MTHSENPFRTPGLVALALLTGPFTLAFCLLLIIVQLPVLGMCSYLVTVPLAALLLGRCAHDRKFGGILGAIAGIASGYGFFLLLAAMGTQGSGRMNWFPFDTFSFPIFIVLPGLVSAFLGQFGGYQAEA